MDGLAKFYGTDFAHKLSYITGGGGHLNIPTPSNTPALFWLLEDSIEYI